MCALQRQWRFFYFWNQRFKLSKLLFVSCPIHKFPQRIFTLFRNFVQFSHGRKYFSCIVVQNQVLDRSTYFLLCPCKFHDIEIDILFLFRIKVFKLFFVKLASISASRNFLFTFDFITFNRSLLKPKIMEILLIGLLQLAILVVLTFLRVVRYV